MLKRRYFFSQFRQKSTTLAILNLICLIFTKNMRKNHRALRDYHFKTALLK